MQWLWENPEVTWSGSGIYVVGLVVSIAVWLYLRKKNSPPPQEDLAACPPNLRRDLLIRLRSDLTGQLASLLDEHNSLNLDKVLSPHEVSHPHSLRDILHEQKGNAPQLTDRSVIEIFNQPDTRQRLAILGKPGSGKTFSLLELLDHLLQLAEQDQKKLAPLPVIFECSEWDGQDLVPWMADQLRKYHLKKELARKLVQDRVIFPLFDGLDELLQTRQDEFVRAFNAFQPGRSLVLCCRIKEYRRLQEKAALNNAVMLQDISLKKLEGYLKSLEFYSLWDFLQQSEEGGAGEESLLQLARRPLFLGIILTLERDNKLVQDAELQSGENAEDRLWQLYLDYCMKEKTQPAGVAGAKKDRHQYSKEQSLHWLRCLARHMTTAKKVELHIDKMQPTMLHVYWRFGISYGLLGGLLFGLGYGLAVGLAYGLGYGLAVGLTVGLALGLIVGMPGIIHFKRIRKIIIGLVVGLAVGLAVGLIGGLVGGLVGGLTFGFLFMLRKDEKPQKIPDIQLLFLPCCVQEWRDFSRGRAFSMVLGLVLGLVNGLVGGLAYGLAYGLVGGLVLGLTYGLAYGLAVGLAFGLAVGLAFGLVGGLSVWLKYINWPRIDTVFPGQAMSLAVWSSVVLLPLISIASMSVFVYFLLQAEQSGFFTENLVTVKAVCLTFAFIIMLCLSILGTDTALQHYLLHLCLWQENQLPLRLVRWLETLHHRKVLQRSGDSYHFIHKQLLEYLARTDQQGPV